MTLPARLSGQAVKVFCAWREETASGSTPTPGGMPPCNMAHFVHTFPDLVQNGTWCGVQGDTNHCQNGYFPQCRKWHVSCYRL
jgi:hypothetical protein